MADLTLTDAILAICRSDGIHPDELRAGWFPCPVMLDGAVESRVAAYKHHHEVEKRARALLQRFRELEELELIRNAKMRHAMRRDRD